jgi:hypothetical protein
LLGNLAVEYELHAVVVLSEQLIEVLFGFLLFTPERLVGLLDFFQFMYLLADQFDVLLEAAAVVYENSHILLVQCEGLFQVFKDK